MNPNPVIEPQQQPAETYESLASLLDYHLLEPTLTTEHVAAACSTARDYRIRAVVVRPMDLHLVTQWLTGAAVIVAGSAGDSNGTSTTAAKLYEARDLLRIGAKEIEFVLNPAAMLSRSFQHVETELLQVSQSCHQSGAKLTVVYHSEWLSTDLKIIATKICRRVEVDVLAIRHSEPDLELLRPLLRDVLTLKQSDPVTNLDQALAARAAGYRSIAITDPAAILDSWKAALAAQAKAS
jgi:deoxyribose-phosphate aldolase